MAKGYLYDNGDELITREDVNEVPDSSSAHAGDVLSLDSNKKPKWSTPESELPDATSASEGDVLSLNASKDPVWSTPSGGGVPTLYAFLSAPNKISFFDSIIPNPESPLSFSDIKDIGEFNYVFPGATLGVGSIYRGYAGADEVSNFLIGGYVYVPANDYLYIYLINDEPLDADTTFDITLFKEIDYHTAQ